MAFEINTQQTAGLTLVARIYNGSTKLGSDVALTENTVEAGLYFSGAVSTSGFADGEHQVIVYDTIAGEILGSGVQIFKDEKTIEDYNLEVLEVDSGQARFTQKALEQAPVADVSSLATSAEVGDIPTNPLLTTDARLNNLDATVSSSSTFDASADEVTTDAASREASKADVSGLASSGDSATILTNQAVINEGIKKASKLIPHNDNL